MGPAPLGPRHPGPARCGQPAGAVEDAGPGLDPQAGEEIFQAFHTSKPQGLGMGLAISRGIVESHGGRLWAEQRPGAGATFCFTLPVAGEGRRHERARSRPRARPGQARVLVVDDDLSMREALASLIGSAGWPVESFASAAELLQRLQTPWTGRPAWCWTCACRA
jgi:hypothetical protein